MKRSRWILGGLLALAACSVTTIHGVTPISPEVGQDPTVETLQPTFRWEPVAGQDARYDFIIYESYGGIMAAVGREVYYREGLQEPEHTIEVELKPKHGYFWSVRVRRGEEVSEWSRYDFRDVGGVPFWVLARFEHDYPFFRFRTPSK